MTGEYDIETPAQLVNVYKDGRLLTRIRCESADDAADAVAQWDGVEGVEFVLEDLGSGHDAFDVLAPEPEDTMTEVERRE